MQQDNHNLVYRIGFVLPMISQELPSILVLMNQDLLKTLDHARMITANVINCQSDRTAMTASHQRRSKCTNAFSISSFVDCCAFPSEMPHLAAKLSVGLQRR